MKEELVYLIDEIRNLKIEFYKSSEEFDEHYLEILKKVDQIFIIIKNLFEGNDDAKKLIKYIDSTEDVIVDAEKYKDYFQLIDVLNEDVISLLRIVIEIMGDNS